MTQELVMYNRTMGCPLVSLSRRVLQEHNVIYRDIFIDKDPQAKERVLKWTGFLAVPTLVVVQAGEDVPGEEPEVLPQGASPRGIDRGLMITEPNEQQLIQWLQKHHIIG